MGLDWNAINIMASDFISEFWPYAAFLGAFGVVGIIFGSAATPGGDRASGSGILNRGGARVAGRGTLAAYIKANRTQDEAQWNQAYDEAAGMSDKERLNKLGHVSPEQYANSRRKDARMERQIRRSAYRANRKS